MKRRIIILTNAGIEGTENYCDGVFRDKENYISFFKSGYGGYYSDTEIRTYDKPSKSKVREEISNLTNDKIEFSIIIFCGHGWYSTISNSNIFELNDNKEQIDSLELRSGAKKRIIIEDNCRKPHDEYLTESMSKVFSTTSLSENRNQQINLEECKRFYNKKISECPEQIIIGQACNIGEVAGDSSSTGGYYSSSLLKQTLNTAKEDLRSIDLLNNFIVYNFPLSHNNAVPIVIARSGNTQNPQIEKPRLSDPNNYLPFAVIA